MVGWVVPPEVWASHSLHFQLNPCFFGKLGPKWGLESSSKSQRWKYNKNIQKTLSVVSEFLLPSVFGERRFCVFVTFFLGMAGLLHHLGKVALHPQPITLSSMPAPRSARKAWDTRVWEGVAGLRSMRLVANHYMFPFLGSTGSVAPMGGALSLMPLAWSYIDMEVRIGAQKKVTPTLTNIENMASWLPGVRLAHAWCCPRYGLERTAAIIAVLPVCCYSLPSSHMLPTLEAGKNLQKK